MSRFHVLQPNALRQESVIWIRARMSPQTMVDFRAWCKANDITHLMGTDNAFTLDHFYPSPVAARVIAWLDERGIRAPVRAG